MVRIVVAELIGTFILVVGGPGTAVLAGDRVGLLGISLAFGFSLLVAAYAIGPISGCHINPAVTFGLAVAKRIEVGLIPAYWAGQFVGGILGGLVVLLLAKGQPGGFDANAGNFATNLWGSGSNYEFFNLGSTILAEIVLTAVLVFVVLSTTHRGFSPGASGLTVGLALGLIHLISIPVDNTSVNPARSLAMAVFAGGDALEKIWVFFIFPIVGAVVGVLAWLAIDDAGLESTLLAETPLVDARDAASGATARLEGALDAAGNRLEDAVD